MFLRSALLFAGACIAGALSSASAALLNGHDLSSVGLMETVQGANWIDTDGNTTTIESIFRDGGMDAVRLRCVRPSLPMTLASH
jgi:arabinogalactan endo-1,4-beta-galactosidase